MTKKGYQKRLPKVLPPPPPPSARRPAPPPPPPVLPALAPPIPAPRTSPERVAQPQAEEAGTPAVLAPAPPGRRLTRTAVVGWAAVGLANLLVSGLIGYLVVGAMQDDSEPLRGPESAGGSAGVEPPRLLRTDGSYVDAVVQPDGQVLVHQWIRSDVPLRRLRLALPTGTGAEALSASSIEVVANGVAVDGPEQITDGAATYTFPGTTNVQVTYRLVGAVARSDSAPGRALALATTLDVRYSPRTQHETRVVRAAEVLALACSATVLESPTPCGEYEGDGQWRVELDGPRVDDRVLAQLTLG